MRPEESNRIKCNIDEIIHYDAKIIYKETPVVAEALQCPDCTQPQPEEQAELPGEDNVCQVKAPVAAEVQQCPSCAKLVDVLKLYCSCNPQKGPEQRIPNSPQQVLADYNSRPPILVNTIARRPANVAAILINAQLGRPAYATAKPNNAQTVHPVYAAPRICNCRKCGR